MTVSEYSDTFETDWSRLNFLNIFVQFFLTLYRFEDLSIFPIFFHVLLELNTVDQFHLKIIRNSFVCIVINLANSYWKLFAIQFEMNINSLTHSSITSSALTFFY